MNSLLFGISLSALLSTISLLVVLFRVSPLMAPVQAVPAFFLCLLLSISTIGTLLFFAFWRFAPLHTWDGGKLLTISLRQGVFLGLATVTLLAFHLLGLLTWWIGLIIYALFVIVELALEH